jgi:hypothetical protein
MIYLLWFLSLILAFIAGFKLGDITKKVHQLEEIVKQKIDKPVERPEPTSEVIDPLDEVQTAMYEYKIMMEKLNPK